MPAAVLAELFNEFQTGEAFINIGQISAFPFLG
jgi:hypothetical protein